MLVTGAAGFIGRNVAAYLRRRGARVRAYDGRFGARFSTADRRRLDRDVRWCAGVIHLAGQASVFGAKQDPQADLEVNVLGTVQLLQALRACPRRLVFPSSIAVYPSRASGLSREADAAPRSFYAAGKLAAEAYVGLYASQLGVPGVALRLGYVYGDDVERGPFADVCRSVALGQRRVQLFTSPRSSFDFIHVDDVAAAFDAALSRSLPAGTVLNVGSGGATTVRELARLAADAAGVPVPATSAPAGAVAVRLAMDSSAALRAMGWRARRSLASGVADYVGHYARR